MVFKEAEINTLIDACLKQDRQAQGKVYQLHVKTMFNSAYRLLRNKQVAEDVTHEAFIKAFSKLDTYKMQVPFNAWLRRIVINEALMYLRSNKNDADNFDEPSLMTISDNVEEVEGFDNESDKIVLNAILQLKDNYRTALQLHFVEGFDYEEMCEILSISYANCRTLISRAKEQLKLKLNNI